MPVLSVPGWREIALWWPERRVLVVAELIGTTAIPPRSASSPAGVHPMLRLHPPGALRGSEPEHLLVGHGRGVHGPAAAAALSGAYSRTRSDLPRLVVRLLDDGQGRAFPRPPRKPT